MRKGWISFSICSIVSAPRKIFPFTKTYSSAVVMVRTASGKKRYLHPNVQSLHEVLVRSEFAAALLPIDPGLSQFGSKGEGDVGVNVKRAAGGAMVVCGGVGGRAAPSSQQTRRGRPLSVVRLRPARYAGSVPRVRRGAGAAA